MEGPHGFQGAPCGLSGSENAGKRSFVYGLEDVSMTMDDISNEQIVIKVIFDFLQWNTR